MLLRVRAAGEHLLRFTMLLILLARWEHLVLLASQHGGGSASRSVNGLLAALVILTWLRWLSVSSHQIRIGRVPTVRLIRDMDL